MAESFNELYQWELIYKQGPWRGPDDVEFATMTYVDWFNHRRLHGQITDDATRAVVKPGVPHGGDSACRSVSQHAHWRRDVSGLKEYVAWRTAKRCAAVSRVMKFGSEGDGRVA